MSESNSAARGEGPLSANRRAFIAGAAASAAAIVGSAQAMAAQSVPVLAMSRDAGPDIPTSVTKSVRRIVTLEEHCWAPPLRATLDPKQLEFVDRFTAGRLYDVGEARIKRMDAAGIDLQVLSFMSPGVQGLDAARAVPVARAANEWIAGVAKSYPGRFAAFAGLPTQDPKAAADELERAVVKLGCKGALVNGHTQGHYLDEPPWRVLWERAQALDVPIYIHPADAPRPILDAYFKEYPELAGAAWGWGIDMGTHVLRLMCGGVFDAYPKAKVIVGHMGELIPFHIRRINRGLSGARTKEGAVMKRTVYEYMHDNVFMTTSGVFDPASLTCAIAAVGVDNVLFSVDDPFEDNAAGVAFLQSAPVSPADREKLAHGNAERLLRV